MKHLAMATLMLLAITFASTGCNIIGRECHLVNTKTGSTSTVITGGEVNCNEYAGGDVIVVP
jgi:hypothetical protein